MKFIRFMYRAQRQGRLGRLYVDSILVTYLLIGALDKCAWETNPYLYYRITGETHAATYFYPYGISPREYRSITNGDK